MKIDHVIFFRHIYIYMYDVIWESYMIRWENYTSVTGIYIDKMRAHGAADARVKNGTLYL